MGDLVLKKKKKMVSQTQINSQCIQMGQFYGLS